MSWCVGPQLTLKIVKSTKQHATLIGKPSNQSPKLEPRVQSPAPRILSVPNPSWPESTSDDSRFYQWATLAENIIWSGKWHSSHFTFLAWSTTFDNYWPTRETNPAITNTQPPIWWVKTWKRDFTGLSAKFIECSQGSEPGYWCEQTYTRYNNCIIVATPKSDDCEFGSLISHSITLTLAIVVVAQAATAPICLHHSDSWLS